MSNGRNDAGLAPSSGRESAEDSGRGLWVACALLAACWIGLAALFDLDVAQRVGHDENWPLGFLLFSPLAVLAVALAVARGCGARWDSRPVGVAVAVVCGAPAVFTWAALGLSGWMALLAVAVVCVAVCALVIAKPKVWPAAVVAVLMPAILVWCMVFFGNLTYKALMSNRNDVGTYAELQNALIGCEDVRFPDLSRYEGVEGFSYYALSRRDVWVRRDDSYGLGGPVNSGGEGLETLTAASGASSSLTSIELVCRDVSRDYGFAEPVTQVEPNTGLGPVAAELIHSERMRENSAGQKLFGYSDGDLAGSYTYKFEVDGYCYKVVGNYGIPAVASEQEAAAKRDDAEAETRDIALSIIEQ